VRIVFSQIDIRNRDLPKKSRSANRSVTTMGYTTVILYTFLEPLATFHYHLPNQFFSFLILTSVYLLIIGVEDIVALDNS
jgi:hypothetical protein